MGRRREKRVMETPDFCRALLKESQAKAACLCIHHDTNVEFGGWAKCANVNTSIPSGRAHAHAVKSTFLSDYSKYAGVEGGPTQKAAGNNTSTKPTQRVAVYRRKFDKRTEQESLRFRHLENSSDHIRRYRDRKHGLFVEKVSCNHKFAPPFCLMQMRRDVTVPDFEGDVTRYVNL